ncbi:hypothetical protein IWX58_003813 [Rubrivivax gelatinosus]|uniref:hypothetical protein n=1 Tax=Rubrivivax gelatinosus TaxID=28068 RepID=UPI0018CB7A1A|nr:hypothetical protein [Rubrivivax gelatinosus]MBG6082126.1 hypothetical protein [Rubrivivax gelatinosus]
MKLHFVRSPLALAALAALGSTVLVSAPDLARAAKGAGQYVTGDFHNHTTCSDGSISMQKLVKKATDKSDTPWGLDWFVQAGHGGNGNRNCTLAEDSTLATPAYPLVYSADGSSVQGPTTTWQNTNPAVQPKGLASGTAPSQNMWRWQSLQEFQYPLLEYLSAYKNKPMFLGLESVVAGHEHSSMSVITGQMPKSMDTAKLPTAAGYTALGNASALSQWEYCFDRADTDTSRGNSTVGGSTGNNWDCSVAGSLNSADPSWNVTAAKLMPASGTGSGERGHAKTVEAIKWLTQKHVSGAYYVPAHLERAGPFNPDGNNGYNVEHLRDFNNAGPTVAFGFETQPGHHASDNRGEYSPNRNTINGVKVDSVGGTTWGGTGVYGAIVGGVWDSLLGEGRNWWFFASSDWHNRGSFGPDDRRSSQDFFPGEYQRDHVMVRPGSDQKLRPQTIVDGLRSGNSFTATGQLIDRLAFVACVQYRGNEDRREDIVEALALSAARGNTDLEMPGCATMGEKLVVRPGADIVVSVVVRDPSGTNYSPYTFANPSLAQVNIHQPLNKPVLDHVDVIRGMVGGYRQVGAADYAGAWPNTWLANPSMETVPAAAKNTTASVIKTFSSATWKTLRTDTQYKRMTFRIPAVSGSQYLRLRGSNLPAGVPWETDASGNPLPDVYTNASNPANLKIACTATGSNVPENGTTYSGAAIDGCPNHLPTVGGVKYVAYDVAAWSDLWFYSNPIFIEVSGGTRVAGIK